MRINKLLKTMSLMLLVLAGCNNPGTEAPTTPETLGSQINEPEAPEAVPTGIDTPIPASDIDLAFRVTGGPLYDAANDSVAYQVEVSNNGKASLISVGKLPVHLGVVVLGSDGTLQTPPANQDFMRVPLPQPLAPGQQVILPITFKIPPTLGGTVIVDAVQEHVSWFREYDKPVLTFGEFMRCSGTESTLCLADGNKVPTVQ